MSIADQKLMHRLDELLEDGYLLKGAAPNTVILTPKGLRTLMAAAERLINKSELKKDMK